jgi:hypothetical protein
MLFEDCLLTCIHIAGGAPLTLAAARRCAVGLLAAMNSLIPSLPLLGGMRSPPPPLSNSPPLAKRDVMKEFAAVTTTAS